MGLRNYHALVPVVVESFSSKRPKILEAALNAPAAVAAELVESQELVQGRAMGFLSL